MEVDFTTEQKQVIELRDVNILVSAAAGSGKTATLTERIVRMVSDEEHPVDIDRLLVVTFTNAAAAEMRERIGQRIGKEIQKHPQSEHLQRQAALLHNAQITTIDSFCLFLVKNHFNEIGLDPAFRVADEREIKLLQQEALEELIEEAYEKKEESFLNCVETLCFKGRDTELEEQIRSLSRYAASFPWPEEWLARRKEDYAASTPEEFCGTSVFSYLADYAAKVLADCAELSQTALDMAREPGGPYMYVPLLEVETEKFRELAREGERLLEDGKLTGESSEGEESRQTGEIPEPESTGSGEKRPDRIELADRGQVRLKNWERLRDGVIAMTFDSLPNKKDPDVDPGKRERSKAVRDGVKKAFGELKDQLFNVPLENVVQQGQACARAVEALVDLALDFDRRMKEKKQERKIIDFTDMEHYALEILLERKDGEIRPSRVAKQYRDYFQEILIDEYQDSNLVQEYLLRAVSGEEDGRFNRFMVGDVKQSIYRFRLARPELFLEKYGTYKQEGDRRRIDLAQNFRSRVTVIDAVNAVFSRLMSRRIGGIDYDERVELHLGAKFPEGDGFESELILTEKPDKTAELNAKQTEALAVALRIQKLLREGRVTEEKTGKLRPIRYRDIVILLRSLAGWSEELQAVLEEQGIPAYVSSKSGYFNAEEVQELLNFLRVVDNPLQDIPLYGVLRSVFGGFTEEEIARIRGTVREGALYEALQSYGGEKTAAFMERLERYRSMTAHLPVRALILRIVEDYDYLNYVTALPGGGKRRANIEMLLVKAADFEKTSYFGLFHFLRYIEQLEKYDEDYGEADTLEENADVVRIMSIHRSKGLEYPVVFVSGLGRKFNMKDINRSVVLDMDLGIGMDYVDSVKRFRCKTLQKNAVAKKLREDSLSEELRLLYVALTRAKEKLILTASSEKIEETILAEGIGEQERLSFSDFIHAQNYLDFLVPILKRTGLTIQVAGEEALAEGRLAEQMELGADRARLEFASALARPESLEILRDRFAFRYPHAVLKDLHTKTTVSELKIRAMSEKDEAAFHAFEEKEPPVYVPRFRRETEEVTGAARGNAYHRAMEILDLQEVLGAQFSSFPENYEAYAQSLDEGKLKESLENFFERQKEEFRLQEEYYKALRMERICRFLKAEIGYRMWRADREGALYREQPFVLAIPASRLSETFPEEEKVLVQGIIDVYFIEEGEIVLLDYKTDVIPNMEALWNRYETQLEYYQEALERLTEKKVKEKILYSFHLSLM